MIRFVMPSATHESNAGRRGQLLRFDSRFCPLTKRGDKYADKFSSHWEAIGSGRVLLVHLCWGFSPTPVLLSFAAQALLVGLSHHRRFSGDQAHKRGCYMTFEASCASINFTISATSTGGFRPLLESSIPLQIVSSRNQSGMPMLPQARRARDGTAEPDRRSS
jgi:hypothetical protein